MTEKSCTELTRPQAAVACCQDPAESGKPLFLACMTTLFLNQFKGIFRRLAVASTLRLTDEQLSDAFGDGLEKFYRHLREHGWSERRSTLRTALFRFGYYQLLKLRKNSGRDNERKSSADPDKDGKTASSTLSPEEILLRKEREQLFQKAFNLLDPQCQDFLLWSLGYKSIEEMEEKYKGIDFRHTEADARGNKEMLSRIRKRYDHPSTCRNKLKAIIDGLW